METLEHVETLVMLHVELHAVQPAEHLVQFNAVMPVQEQLVEQTARTLVVLGVLTLAARLVKQLAVLYAQEILAEQTVRLIVTVLVAQVAVCNATLLVFQVVTRLVLLVAIVDVLTH